MEAGRIANRRSHEARRRQQRRRGLRRLLLLVVLVIAVVLAVVLTVRGCSGAPGGVSSTTVTSAASAGGAGGPSTSGQPAGSGSSSGVAGVSANLRTFVSTGKASPNTTLAPGTGRADQPGAVRVPGSFYGPIQTTFEGLTMFRGNGSRTYYGEGPVPTNPQLLWKFGPMSGTSTNLGKTSTWTGTGWTGQPCIFERDGKTWVVFGAYDYKIHFLDGATGEKLLPDFKGKDIFKGSVVVDPDGYPLIYMGCRDNKWRIIAIDRDEPTELFNLNADTLPNKMWNDDWDSSVVIRNDYAFEGGENSHFYILKLNRGYDAEGKVTVDPQTVLDYPAWTQSLLDKLGSKDVSVESSPCLVGDRVYFSTSAGLVIGLDVSATLKDLAPGEKPPTGIDSYPVVFRYWMGGDADPTVVADEEGFIYACQHSDKRSKAATDRYKEVGQVVKLDPRKAGEGENPVVWSQAVTKLSGGESGVWATPCLYKGLLYVPTHGGGLLGIDRQTGELLWQKTISEHAWASCIVVDETLIVGDTYGALHAWDVSDTRIDPPVVWEYKVPSGSALESTPAVWKGRVYAGSRDGYFYCFEDQ